MGVRHRSDRLEKLRFGNFEVDLETGELRKHGLRIRLPEQAFQVLALLLDRAAELVTRDELKDILWPADSFVDFDHGLNKAINKIREALGDSADHPHFIETLPRRGYRFIGHIETTGPAPAGVAVPQVPIPAVRPKRAGLLWVIATLAVLGFLAAAITRPAQKLASPPPIRASILLSPEAPFVAWSQAVSPDGTRLAVTARANDSAANGNDLLWVRSLNSLSARPLPGTEGAGYPFWSPDGRYIGFFEGPILKKVDASGGPATTIADVRSHGRGGTWNRDGWILFATSAPGPIYSLSGSGSAPATVTKLDASRRQISHRWPYFLPDGQHFLYTAREVVDAPQNETNAIYVGSLDEKTNQFLFYADSNAVYTQGYLLCVRQGSLMAHRFDVKRLRLSGSAEAVAGEIAMTEDHGAFSASESGLLVYRSGNTASQLLWFDRSGRQGGSVGEIGQFYRPRFSADGKWVAVDCLTAGRVNRDIWLYETSHSVGTQLTFDPSVHTHPVWSPDGSHLVYSSNRNETGQRDLVERPTSGTGDEHSLFRDDGDKTVSDWSPDGRFLAYNRREPKGIALALWILPLTGERKPFAFQPAEFEQKDGQFSHDGRWLAYTSAASGRAEVYVARFPDGWARRRVSLQGGSQPRWRRDGKELYYLSPDDKLMAAELRQGDGRLEVGRVQVLFQARPKRVVIGHVYDVSSDGQRFLISTLIEEKLQPLTIVTNWSAGLRR